MMKYSSRTSLLSMTAVLACFATTSRANAGHGYEVWAADQSNTVSGVALGSKGSQIWIWDSVDIEAQIAGGPLAVPVGCDGGISVGPCDMLDVFPQTLAEYDASGNATGNTLGMLPAFGRLHGLIPDPQNEYFTVNIFAPSGGYVGIIDAKKKEATALFRVTDTNVGRSVHMSFWRADGSGIIVANLNGKTLERIDIDRNSSGKITGAHFNRSASLGLGKGMVPTASATVFLGKNAHHRDLIGDVVGDYANADFGDLTANGECKENGCGSGPDAANGGRPNNLVICPIPSSGDKGYVTLGGGGLVIADLAATPMTIVGEYGNQIFNGAGCAGAQSGNQVWLNAGVSASGAGFNQSSFTLYVLEDNQYDSVPNLPDFPLPSIPFKDATNTTHLGNLQGAAATNDTGQIPGVTTRRDAHGAATTVDGVYVHNVDRIQNIVEVFDTRTLGTRYTYDLTSADGQGNGDGPCLGASVGDDIGLPLNDPAPDLLQATPDGKFLAVALRGPAPVTVQHGAQGSCPGVGIIELSPDGSSGKLKTVLRTTNTLDNAPMSAPGGHAYTGAERSDIHGASVIAK